MASIDKAGVSPQQDPWPQGGRTLLIVSLLGAIYLGYSPALDGELQFDDLRSIVTNSAIKDLHALTRSGLLGVTRVLTDATFALNYRFTALAVRPYHLVNLAAHLATVLALVVLSARILRRLKLPAPFATSVFAAAVFGLHPLQTQAVAYVCQRAEVLAALLYVLTLLFALDAVWNRENRAVAVVGAFTCFLLGWGAKPTIATVPAALLLCLAAFPGTRAAPGSWRKRIVLAVPFGMITAALSWRLLASVRGSGDAGFGPGQVSAGTYLLTQSRVILTYLRLLFWPVNQNVDWQVALSTSAFEPRTLLAIAAIAAILLAAAWLWRWSGSDAADEEVRAVARLAAFGILWFFLLLAPTSSVVPVADVLEEHRVYLASWGIFLPLTAAGTLWLRRFGRPGLVAGVGAALCLCAVLGIALHRRAGVWATQVSLWTDAVAKSPGKARPHMNLGFALAATDAARALAEFRVAQQFGDPTINGNELQQNIAGALLSLHRYDEAISILEDVRGHSAPSPQLDTNLAIACLEAGRLDEARSRASRVVEQFPRYAPAWHTLGQLASKRGDYSTAEHDFRRAAELDPDSSTELSSLAVTLERMGDRARACATWARFVERTSGEAAEAGSERFAALGCAQR